MIWEFKQQSNINRAQRTAERAKSKADRFSQDISDIKQQMGRLSLACQAMWELLRDFSELKEEDIENKILEVDLRDGRTDGKMQTQLLDCANCGKPTNSRRSICVMCGAPLERPHKFEP